MKRRIATLLLVVLVFTTYFGTNTKVTSAVVKTGVLKTTTVDYEGTTFKIQDGIVPYGSTYREVKVITCTPSKKSDSENSGLFFENKKALKYKGSLLTNISKNAAILVASNESKIFSAAWTIKTIIDEQNPWVDLNDCEEVISTHLKVNAQFIYLRIYDGRRQCYIWRLIDRYNVINEKIGIFMSYYSPNLTEYCDSLSTFNSVDGMYKARGKCCLPGFDIPLIRKSIREFYQNENPSNHCIESITVKGIKSKKAYTVDVTTSPQGLGLPYGYLKTTYIQTVYK